MKRKILVALVALVVLALASAGWMYHSITKRVVGQFFDADGVRIHYTDEGKGDPVILVHGFAANADANWRTPGITQALAKDFRVIVLDNRGHGLSDKPHEQSKYGTEFCKDIIRLMDHLHIEKAQVVGYSMGSFITLKLVTMYPERLLSAAPCGAGWERAGDPNDRREQIAAALEKNGDFSELFNVITPAGKKIPRQGIMGINYTLGLLNDTKALAAVMRSIGDLTVTEEELRACKVPTLSIAGTNDPLRTGVDRMKDVMANHETVYVDGTDHITTIASPKFIDTLRTFLNAHRAVPIETEKQDKLKQIDINLPKDEIVRK